MSGPGEVDATRAVNLRQMADWFAAGGKPRDRWRIGTEHERFGFRRTDLGPPTYDEPNGIRAFLDSLGPMGWQPILEGDHPIGAKKGGANVSLEPGGQTELSGAPLVDLHETKAELDAHLAELRTIGDALGLGWAPLGFHPTARREDMPWMPKGRYAIMRRYMPLRGRLGLDMMLRTCTVQANLDYLDEADMVEKLRMSLGLQPVATALFANSPFTEGKPNGFRSFRANTWTDTDPDRCGIPEFVFEDGFGFERFAEWILQVPMYFVYRGRYIDVAGERFPDFMEGRLGGELTGHYATMGDFADHVTTAFTEVRVKRYLEMRGADSGDPAMLMALPAFWVGLLYDDAAQKAAYSLIHGHTCSDFRQLVRDVPRMGLDTPWCDTTVRWLARDAVRIAKQGLKARGRLNAAGQDESIYLEPLEEIIASGRSPADRWLERFHGAWGGDVTKIFAEAAL